MKSIFLVLLPFLMLIAGCDTNENKNIFIDQEVMIPVHNSELYVRLRGNPKKPLIINLHGGPGGYSGIDIKLMGPKLEKEFLVAYLDQRGCGKSPECKNTGMLTVAQYVEDLNVIVDSLKNKFDKSQVNLLGTSWGGMYGFIYLLDHGNKINAFACVDGKVNSNYQNHSLIDFEMQRADELLKSNIPEKREAEIQQIKNELFRIKQSNFENFHTDVNRMKHEFPRKLGFNAYFADTSKIISLNDVLADTALLNLMNYTEDEYLKVGEKAETVNRAFRNTPSYNKINIEPDLVNISTPVAVIQGEKDYVVGTEHAQLIYDALTNLPSAKKEIHIIPNVAHCPAIESPNKLMNILTAFFIQHSKS